MRRAAVLAATGLAACGPTQEDNAGRLRKDALLPVCASGSIEFQAKEAGGLVGQDYLDELRISVRGACGQEWLNKLRNDPMTECSGLRCERLIKGEDKKVTVFFQNDPIVVEIDKW